MLLSVRSRGPHGGRHGLFRPQRPPHISSPLPMCTTIGLLLLMWLVGCALMTTAMATTAGPPLAGSVQSARIASSSGSYTAAVTPTTAATRTTAEHYIPNRAVLYEARVLDSYITLLDPSIRWNSTEDQLHFLDTVLSKPLVSARLGTVAPPPKAQTSFYTAATTSKGRAAAGAESRRQTVQPLQVPQLSILYAKSVPEVSGSGEGLPASVYTTSSIAKTATDAPVGSFTSATAAASANTNSISRAGAWATLRAKSILKSVRSSRSPEGAARTATTLVSEGGGDDHLSGAAVVTPEPAVRETLIEVHDRKTRIPVTMVGSGVTVIAIDVAAGNTLNTVLQLRAHRYDTQVPEDNCFGVYTNVELRSSYPRPSTRVAGASNENAHTKRRDGKDAVSVERLSYELRNEAAPAAASAAVANVNTNANGDYHRDGDDGERNSSGDGSNNDDSGTLQAFWTQFAHMFDTSAYCEGLPSLALRISKATETQPYYVVLRSKASSNNYYNNYYDGASAKARQCQLYVYVEQIPAKRLRVMQVIFSLVIPLLIVLVPLPFELWRADIIQSAMLNIDLGQWMYYPPFLLRRKIVQGCVMLYHCVRGCRAAQRARQLQERLAAQQRDLAAQMESQFEANAAVTGASGGREEGSGATAGTPGMDGDGSGGSTSGSGGGWGGWGTVPVSRPSAQSLTPPPQQQHSARHDLETAVTIQPPLFEVGPSPDPDHEQGSDDAQLLSAMEPSSAVTVDSANINNGNGAVTHHHRRHARAEATKAADHFRGRWDDGFACHPHNDGARRVGSSSHASEEDAEEGDSDTAVSVSSSTHRATHEEQETNRVDVDSPLRAPFRVHKGASNDVNGGVYVKTDPLAERFSAAAAGGVPSHELLFATAAAAAATTTTTTTTTTATSTGGNPVRSGASDTVETTDAAARAAVGSHATEGNDEEGERFCRICREDGTEEALVAPCSCIGSVRWVHRSCLDHWRLESAKRNLNNVNRCEICKQNFTIGINRATVCWEGSKKVINGVLLFFTCLLAIFLITTLSHTTFGELSCLADYHQVSYVTMYSFEGLTLSIFLYLLCLILVLYANLIVYSWFRSRADVQEYLNEMHVMPPFLTHRNVTLILIVCGVLCAQGISVGYLLKFFLYFTSDIVWNWEISPFIGGLLLMLLMTCAMGVSVTLRDTITSYVEQRRGTVGHAEDVVIEDANMTNEAAENRPAQGGANIGSNNGDNNNSTVSADGNGRAAEGTGDDSQARRSPATSCAAGAAAVANAVTSGSGSVEAGREDAGGGRTRAEQQRPQPGQAGDEDYTQQFSIPPDQRVIRAFEYCPPRRTTRL